MELVLLGERVDVSHEALLRCQPVECVVALSHSANEAGQRQRSVGARVHAVGVNVPDVQLSTTAAQQSNAQADTITSAHSMRAVGVGRVGVIGEWVRGQHGRPAVEVRREQSVARSVHCESPFQPRRTEVHTDPQHAATA